VKTRAYKLGIARHIGTESDGFGCQKV
jgi:hypothetical protein